MAIAAEPAIREWVNGRPDLVGSPDAKGPLGMGAFLAGCAFGPMSV